MGNNLTEQFFLDKGFTKNSLGQFVPPIGKTVVKLGGNHEVLVSSKFTPKQPVIITPYFVLNSPVESFLTLNGIIAGLNGDKGLMRSHWSNSKKQKDLYRMIIKDHIRENKVRRHTGPVTLTYIGYKSRFMDWDNFSASFKFLGDSLVKEKIILDDSPKIIQNFIPKQIKCKQTEQKVIIIIQDL